MMPDKVVTFPQTSEVDRQFLELERQREAIREQARLIMERQNEV
tara:strand:- start:405 stop:536 length:132 start_codon:yes stop_codon:yes gene_type:complete